MAVSTFLWLTLALWGLGAAIAVLHRLGLRVSRQLLRVLLGALVALHLLGLGDLLVVPLSGGGRLPLALAVLVPVTYFAILAAYVAESVAAAVFLIHGLLGVYLFVGLGLPALDRLVHLTGALGADGELPPAHLLSEARLVAGDALGFFLGAYVMLVLFQALLNRWQARSAWLAAGLALLAGGTVGRGLAVFLGAAGSPDWPWWLGAEVLGWGLSGLLLWPLQALYLGLLARREGVVPAKGRSALEVLRTTRSLQEALEAAAARADRLGEHLRLISDVGRAVLRAESPQALLQSVGDRLLASPQARRVWLGLVDGEGGLRSVALFDGRGGKVDLQGLEVGVPALALRALGEGGPVQGPGGEVAVPLEAGGGEMGALWVAPPAGCPPDEGWRSTLARVAADLAHGLNRLRALESEHRRRAELEALRQASLSLTSRLDLHSVLARILEHALRLVDADDAHIFIYDGQRLRFGAALWAGGVQKEPFAKPRPHGLTYSVARSGQRIVINDARNHPLFEDMPWDGAIVGLPLKVEGRVVGVMNVAFTRSHRFDDDELRALELLGDQAAIALQNARLFERTLADRRRVLLLYEVTRALAASLDPDLILERAVGLTAETLGGLHGLGFLQERGGDRLRVRVAYGFEDLSLREVDERLSLCVGEGLVGWVVAHREPVLVEDVREDRRWVPVPEVDAEVRSLIATPISAGEGLRGALVISRAEPGAFDEEHLDLLVSIGQQVGLALSNAERYRQVERRLTELTAIQQVAQVINRRLDMGSLLEAVVEQVHAVLGYPVVDIALVEGGELVQWAGRGAPRARGRRFPLYQGVVGRAVRTGEPQFVPDVRQDPDYVALEVETASEIAVPLKKGEVVIGVLNVESQQQGGLTEDDLRLLTLLGDQISIALENAALYDRLRQQASRLEEMVARRTAELAEALEQAREADRLKSEFVSDVSHELRTPLSNIRLYAELLAQGKPERFQEYLRTLERETERLSILIEDLLTISRLDAGASRPILEPVDVNLLLRTLVQDRQRLFAEKGLDLTFEAAADLPEVIGDPAMLSQVVANLMTNALNYTPSGGRVRLSTESVERRGRRWVKVEVSDTGVGIPEEEQERLFERFFRGSAARASGAPGTGLGLAICKEILDRHGGGITVHSRPGEGSTFTVWLPARQWLVRREATASEGLA